MGINKIQGANIYLGSINREQLKQYFESFEQDFEYKTEYLGGFGWPVEGSDKIFDDISKDYGEKIIELGIYTHDDRLVGDIALHTIQWRNRSAEIGVGIASKDNRGKGYGTEAVKLILSYAFNDLGLDRVGANTFEHNTGCRRALEKNGMVQEGVNRKAAYIAGRYYDRILYSMLRDEYKK